MLLTSLTKMVLINSRLSESIMRNLIISLFLVTTHFLNSTERHSLIDQSKYEVYKDIVWVSKENFDLSLDIYVPNSSLKKLPVLLIFHGGGWLIRDKSIMDQMAQYIASKSEIIVCNINYRLLSDLNNTVKMNEIIEDVFGSLLWVKNNIHLYKGDATQVAVTGDSAGGHLASMIVNSGDRISLNNNFAESLKFTPTFIPKESKEKILEQMQVKASILSYGAFDIYAGANDGFETYKNPFWSFSRSTPRKIFGEGFDHVNNPEMYKAVSPLYNIPEAKKKILPPQMLLVGSNDRLTTPESVKDYFNALQAKGHQAYYWEYPGKGHAFLDSGKNYFLGTNFERDAPEALDKMINFLNSVFK